MHPQDLAEEFGDGCSNDLQRAFAISQMLYAPVDERELAVKLVRKGLTIVMIEYQAFCRSTDAFLGTDYCIHSQHLTEDSAQKVLREQDCPDMWIVSLDTLKKIQERELIGSFEMRPERLVVVDEIPF